jgi:sugar phosphate isomerase/epimerase
VWLKGVLDRLGLSAPLTHTAPKLLLEKPDAVIEAHKTLGAHYLGIGSCPGIFQKVESIKPLDEIFDAFVKDFTPVIEKIKAAGLQFGYHNHHREFAKLANGKVFLDATCDVFTPDQCAITLDTYWVQAGGGDPAAWLRRLDGRIKCIHFKDMVFSTEEQKVHYAPIGEGNLNWEAIFEAVRECDVDYAFVEQDSCYGEDPFDCLERSLKFIRANGFAN